MKKNEKAENRREEIINACAVLYKTKNFQEITIKDIGEVTSFSSSVDLQLLSDQRGNFSWTSYKGI